jgi:hypothetical protein
MEAVMRALFAFALIASLSSAASAAMDIPARKAGLWQMIMTFEGRGIPQQTIKQCIDAATDKLMNSMGGGMSKEACSKHDMQRVGNTIVVDSVCKSGMAAGTTTSHAVVSGDFNSGYMVKVDSRREGAPAPGMPPSGAMKMTIEAKWLGPCAGDQKPGDMIMGNGMKMNIRDMQQMQGGGGMPPKR